MRGGRALKYFLLFLPQSISTIAVATGPAYFPLSRLRARFYLALAPQNFYQPPPIARTIIDLVTVPCNIALRPHVARHNLTINCHGHAPDYPDSARQPGHASLAVCNLARRSIQLNGYHAHSSASLLAINFRAAFHEFNWL